MKIKNVVLWWLCLVGSLPPVAAYAVSGQPFNNQLIIKYKATTQLDAETVRPQRVMQNLKTPNGESITFKRRLGNNSMVVQLSDSLTNQQVQDVVASLSRDASVEYAQIDKRMYPAFVPADPRYPDQWYLFESFGINMQDAWDVSPPDTRGNASVVIAVLDSGILTHDDLDPARILSGYDFISDTFTANDNDGRDADPSDPGDAVAAGECAAGDPQEDSSWHGLSVIGVIAATTDNNIGITGIDFAARILPLRVLGKCGGAVSDIIDAMRWSVGLPVAGVPVNTSPVKVVNLSLSGEGACSQAEQDAINAVRAAGAIVVTAAGNETEDIALKSPANCQGVITVGATARNGDRTSYVNFGQAVDLSAPGGDGADGIWTLSNTGTDAPVLDTLALIQGTSFTTAQVSAVAGLMYAVNNSLTPTDVAGILCATTQAFPGGTCTTSTCGTGILDALAALTAAQNPSSVLPAACADNDATRTTGPKQW